MIQMAVTRRTWQEPQFVLAPGERVSVEPAIRAVTAEAAWQLRSEHEIGSLESGKLAAVEPIEHDGCQRRMDWRCATTSQLISTCGEGSSRRADEVLPTCRGPSVKTILRARSCSARRHRRSLAVQSEVGGRSLHQRSGSSWARLWPRLHFAVPTIFNEAGFRFMIDVHDHAPAHIHVLGHGGAVELLIEPLSLPAVRGNLTDAQVRKVVQIATSSQGERLQAWKNHHG